MAEKAQILVDIEAGGAAKNLGELESRAKGLNEALEGADFGTKEFKDLRKELIKTNREIKNTELGMEALDTEQIASEFGGLTGAISDVTVGLSLLGDQNEEVQKIAESVEKGIGFTVAFKGGIEGATAAMKLLKNANPFQLFLTIITLVIAAVVILWDNLAAIADFFVQILEWMGILDDSERVAAEERSKRNQQLAKEHNERVKNIEAERDARRKAHAESQEMFDLEIAALEAVGKSSFKLRLAKEEDRKATLLGELESIGKLTESWTTYYEQQFAMSGKSKEDFVKQLKGQGIDIEKLEQQRLELVEDVENEIRRSEIEITKIKFDEGQKRQAEQEKLDDEAAAKEKERLQELEDARLEFLEKQKEKEEELAARRLAAQDALDAIEIQRIEDQFEKKEVLAMAQFEKRIENLSETIPEENQLIIELRRDLEAQLDDIDQERKDKEEEDRKERIANIKSDIDLGLDMAASSIKNLQSLNDLAFGKDLKRIKEKQKAGEKLTRAEAQRLKRQEAIQKAFALAQIAVDTAKGISGAVAQAQSVPYPGNLIAIGTGIAAVLAGVAGAAAVLSGGSPSVPSTGGSDTNFDGDIKDLTGDTPDVGGGVGSGSTIIDPPPQKVFVTESDITDTQDSVKAIVTQSEFG